MFCSFFYISGSYRVKWPAASWLKALTNFLLFPEPKQKVKENSLSKLEAQVFRGKTMLKNVGAYLCHLPTRRITILRGYKLSGSWTKAPAGNIYGSKNKRWHVLNGMTTVWIRRKVFNCGENHNDVPSAKQWWHHCFCFLTTSLCS